MRKALGELDVDGPTLEDGRLVASELVTNVVRHSGCATEHMLEVRASRDRDRLLISVHDPGISHQSAQARDDGGELGGWGLRIVEQLAQRWGSERPDGHRVWAELALRD